MVFANLARSDYCLIVTVLAIGLLSETSQRRPLRRTESIASVCASVGDGSEARKQVRHQRIEHSEKLATTGTEVLFDVRELNWYRLN